MHIIRLHRIMSFRCDSLCSKPRPLSEPYATRSPSCYFCSSGVDALDLSAACRPPTRRFICSQTREFALTSLLILSSILTLRKQIAGVKMPYVFPAIGG